MTAHHNDQRRSGDSAVTLAALLAAHVLLAAPAKAETEALGGVRLAEALREGGKVIFIRHASTEEDYADQIKAVMGNCATQRALSEAGWHEAQNIGSAIDWLDIPIGDVISSEYCRAWQTASLPLAGTKRTIT